MDKSGHVLLNNGYTLMWATQCFIRSFYRKCWFNLLKKWFLFITPSNWWMMIFPQIVEFFYWVFKISVYLSSFRHNPACFKNRLLMQECTFGLYFSNYNAKKSRSSSLCIYYLYPLLKPPRLLLFYSLQLHVAFPFPEINFSVIPWFTFIVIIVYPGTTWFWTMQVCL